jgi:hypothetical protein
MGDTNTTMLEPMQKLARDIALGAKTLGRKQARFLVDDYYALQEPRKAASNQVYAMEKSKEPHEILIWFRDNAERMERSMHRVLDAYSDQFVVGRWAKTITGIDKVISAALLAYIDISMCPRAGNIWRFAGQDSTNKWLGKEGASKLVQEIVQKNGKLNPQELLVQAAVRTGRKYQSLLRQATTTPKGEHQDLTRDGVRRVMARRPWNADLKVLCWKIGESFVKQSGRESDFYGKLLLQRKAYEIGRNERGELADQAAEVMRTKKIGKGTDAYPWYAGCVTPTAANEYRERIAAGEEGVKPKRVPEGEGQLMLPPGHIHARAKRWAVKLFLSHWHWVAHIEHFGREPVEAYSLAVLGGHTHKIEVPNWPMK